MLDDYRAPGGFIGSTPPPPKPFYHRLCWHIWTAFLNRRTTREGPAAQADMDAARAVWESLDEDTRDFITFVHITDYQWTNIRACAQIFASKHRQTITSVIKAFDQANRQLAVTRGIIDN